MSEEIKSRFENKEEESGGGPREPTRHEQLSRFDEPDEQEVEVKRLTTSGSQFIEPEEEPRLRREDDDPGSSTVEVSTEVITSILSAGEARQLLETSRHTRDSTIRMIPRSLKAPPDDETGRFKFFFKRIKISV